MDYTRPEITKDDQQIAVRYFKELSRKYGYSAFPIIINALCLENIRLMKECNEHRAARDIAPLETLDI